jgi:hypothetical protein
MGISTATSRSVEKSVNVTKSEKRASLLFAKLTESTTDATFQSWLSIAP